MKTPEVTFNRRLALLVLASFAVFATVVVLRVGIGATPYETTDSAGRAMGFNDPLNAEHYRIMAGNFRATALLDAGYLYEWILLAAHGLGAFFLLSAKVGPRFTRWFFALQAVVFPIGVPCLLFLPMFLLGPGPLDRESFIDIPFIIFVAQPVWIAASLIIVLTLRGPGLGLAGAWKSLRETARAGRQKLAGVMLR